MTRSNTHNNHKLRGLMESYPVFWATVSILYALVFITIEFSGNPVSGFRGFVQLASQWFIVAFCSSGVIGLMCAWRTLFSLSFPLLIVCSTILAYYRVSMGVGLTPMTIELAMVNDMNTWATVINGQLVALALLAFAVSLVPVIWRWRHVRPGNSLDCAVLSLLIVSLPVGVVPRINPAVMSRMPYVFFSATDRYLHLRTKVAQLRDTFDDVPASAPEDSLDVVFVIGESLRADHLQLNGYPRPTTPGLAEMPNLVSLPEMHTEPFYTHTSVPRIMTRADSGHPQRAVVEQSFITLFRKAGFHTLWISNQDMADSYAYFMHEADSLIYINSGKSLYDYDRWMDVDMLPHFRREAMRNKKNLTVMHSIGSHWWYGAHYDGSSAPFRPDADSRIISELSREQMVNSYDNTIVETDRFLCGIIDLLRNRNAVLIYISDHGEALGEDGKYLHAEDYPQLHNPAAFVWWSDRYEASHPEEIEALRINSKGKLSTDAMFHSALDAARIATPALDRKQSIFSNKNK